MVDPHEIRHPQLAEGHAHRRRPELIVVLGITHRHVAQQPLGEPEACEQPRCAGQPLEAVRHSVPGSSNVGGVRTTKLLGLTAMVRSR